MKASSKKAANTTGALVLKPEQPELKPSLDFPAQDEKIGARHYSVRVTAHEKATQVDVSVDQGAWLACRNSSGHWWFDLTDSDLGEHEIIARARQGDGRWMVCVPVEFVAA